MKIAIDASRVAKTHLTGTEYYSQQIILGLSRIDHKNQYTSVYQWQAKSYHDRFMKKYHDWLVSKSSAKVKVLGYFNLKKL